MIKITRDLIEEISQRAKNAPRRRINYNFHKVSSDPVQRFMNAVEPGTYLRPHKHDVGKAEVMLILRGRVLMVEFDDKGNIADHVVLDSDKGEKGVELPAGSWHSFISLQEGSVLYEVKAGPYDEKKAKHFAEWSPEEGSKEALLFNKRVIEKLKIS